MHIYAYLNGLLKPYCVLSFVKGIQSTQLSQDSVLRQGTQAKSCRLHPKLIDVTQYLEALVSFI